MKRCPYCAEKIQDAAIVCRYCGRDLPSEHPEKATGEGAGKGTVKQPSGEKPISPRSPWRAGAIAAGVVSVLTLLNSGLRYIELPTYDGLVFRAALQEWTAHLVTGLIFNALIAMVVVAFAVWLWRKSAIAVVLIAIVALTAAIALWSGGATAPALTPSATPTLFVNPTPLPYILKRTPVVGVPGCAPSNEVSVGYEGCVYGTIKAIAYGFDPEGGYEVRQAFFRDEGLNQFRVTISPGDWSFAERLQVGDCAMVWGTVIWNRNGIFMPSKGMSYC